MVQLYSKDYIFFWESKCCIQYDGLTKYPGLINESTFSEVEVSPLQSSHAQRYVIVPTCRTVSCLLEPRDAAALTWRYISARLCFIS